MHSLVRRYLKTAIAFLGLGLGIGLWLVARRELAGVWPAPHLVSAHVHAVLVGFVLLLILGVALWLFPRPAADDVRYSPRLAGAAYWCVTLGTATRVVGELARGAGAGHAAVRWAVVLASAAQVVGVGVYFHTMWGRIRPVGSAQREAKGERF